MYSSDVSFCSHLTQNLERVVVYCFDILVSNTSN